MNERQRQAVLFVGFTVILVAVLTFLLSQGDLAAPSGPEVDNSNLDAVNNATNESIAGWKQFYRDFQNGLKAIG